MNPAARKGCDALSDWARAIWRTPDDRRQTEAAVRCVQGRACQRERRSSVVRIWSRGAATEGGKTHS
jgi:hypothetical protein